MPSISTSSVTADGFLRCCLYAALASANGTMWCSGGKRPAASGCGLERRPLSPRQRARTRPQSDSLLHDQGRIRYAADHGEPLRVRRDANRAVRPPARGGTVSLRLRADHGVGLITDNSPPNTAIVDFVKQWNAKHGHRIELELTTLQGFFDTLRASDADIPVHRGDWPDWWSDGVSSTALSTQLFRDAQRMLQSVRALDTAKRADDRMLDAAEYNLMMYAEHTWGYSSSIGEPWHPMVQALEARKAQFAAEAHRLVYSALDDVLESRGEVSLSAETDLSYLVLNPQPSRKTGLAALHVHYWQLPVISQGFEILNETTGDYVAHQKQKSARGTLVVVPYDLAAGSEARYRSFPRKARSPQARRRASCSSAPTALSMPA